MIQRCWNIETYWNILKHIETYRNILKHIELIIAIGCYWFAHFTKGKCHYRWRQSHRAKMAWSLRVAVCGRGAMVPDSKLRPAKEWPWWKLQFLAEVSDNDRCIMMQNWCIICIMMHWVSNTTTERSVLIVCYRCYSKIQWRPRNPDRFVVDTSWYMLILNISQCVHVFSPGLERELETLNTVSSWGHWLPSCLGDLGGNYRPEAFERWRAGQALDQERHVSLQTSIQALLNHFESMGQTIGLYWHCLFVSFLLGIFLAPHLGQIVKYQAELPGVTSSMSTIRREDLQLPRDSWGRCFLLASYDVLWVGTSLEMGVLKGTLSWKWNAKWKSCWNTSCSVWASIDLSRLWFRSTIGLYENGVLLSTVQCTPESDFALIFHIQSAILGYGQTHNPEARTALNTRPAWRCGDGGATKGRGQLEGKRSNQLAGVNSCRILSPSCLDVPWCS